MAEKYFKKILETYYKDSFTDPTGSQGKNFVSKINGCISTTLNLSSSELIVLPQGCYSKMIDSEDIEFYSKCLKQFGEIDDANLELISKCVSSNPIN